tara:strand:+ start:7924 stop:8217 length:294 start_codon:yes stop_codon:yes gene_type:complete
VAKIKVGAKFLPRRKHPNTPAITGNTLSERFRPWVTNELVRLVCLGDHSSGGGTDHGTNRAGDDGSGYSPGSSLLFEGGPAPGQGQAQGENARKGGR